MKIKTENIEFQQKLDAAIDGMQAATTREELAVCRNMAENVIKNDKRHSEEYLYLERARLESACTERLEKVGFVSWMRLKEIKEANRRQYAEEQAVNFREAQKCCNAAWLAETLTVAKQRGIISDYSLTITRETEKGGENE